MTNPGSYRLRKKVQLRSILRKQLQKLRRGQFKELYYLSIAESHNLLSQNRIENRFFCNCCKTASTYFLTTWNENGTSRNSVCPICDSRKRHRGLYELYSERIKPGKKISILHFAPETIFVDLFSSHNYLTTDLFEENVDYPGEDITQLSFESDQFDLILCNHVLEHIENDTRAIEELNRILAPGGIAIITVPGDWRKEKTHTFDELTQNGHFRHYGMDFLEKLEVFEKVESIDLFSYNPKYKLPLGLEQKSDLAFICHKH